MIIKTIIEENTAQIPLWLQYVSMFAGSGGVLWIIWSKFGEAIKGSLNLKSQIQKGNLENELEEMNVFEKYKQVLNQDMNDLMDKYIKLKEQVDIDHKKLTDQIKEDRRIMKNQKVWILYATKTFVENNIKYRAYIDEEFD